MQIQKDIRNIWQYLQKYKKKVYFIAFVALISSAISAVIPYIYGRLVDIAVKPSGTLKLIFEILGLWLILTLISNWANRYVDKRGINIAVMTSNDLVLDINSHIARLPVAFHKEKKMGEVIQRVFRAGDFIDTIISQTLFDLVPGLLRIIIALIVLTYVDWRLSSAISVIIVFYLIATLLKTKPIIVTQKRVNRAYEKGYGDIYNSITNIQVVKSSVAEKFEDRRNLKNFEKMIEKMKLLMKAWIDIGAWQQTIFGIGFVAIFGLGVFFLKSGAISAGELVMFVGYTSLIYQPIGQLAHNYRLLKRGTVVIERALKFKNIKPENYNEGVKPREIKGEVIFDDVSFAYIRKKRLVLKNIGFKIKPGEVVALVGHSGVGKTTLADLISRYIIPIKGRILIDGRDIQKINLHSLRKNIAIVPQEITLFNDTIKNNIAYGRLNASMRNIVKVAIAANAHEFIMKFPKKYKQLVGERGIKLSTGQKQRIAIARALLRDPKILILDEATSALDSVSEKLVQEALKRLIQGRTTFIIAHRLSTIRHADKIFVFEKGRIIERGKHDELMKKKNGLYRKFYMMQSAFGEEEKV